MQDIDLVKGTVAEIQRYSVHDGPGIRSLVFLKGCPLRCKWCCNPENISRGIQTMMVQGETKTVGRELTVAEVMAEIRKDRIYYRRSGGGVTLSGGEALSQPEFALALLQACKREGVHTAIETSGFADFSVFESVLPFLDYVMFDIKHVEEEKHKEFTGQSNRLILENVMKVAEKAKELVIRVPVIPTFNDTIPEILMISLFAAQIPGVKRMHLLPYHRLGESKYQGLGWDYSFSSVPPPTPEQMDELLAIARISGLACQIGG